MKASSSSKIRNQTNDLKGVLLAFPVQCKDNEWILINVTQALKSLL